VLRDPFARIAALNNLALSEGEAGEHDQAIAHVEQALALCAAIGDRHHEAALRNNLADLFRASGRRPEALAQLKQAVTIFAEIGVDAGQWQPEIWKLAAW
jgi:tetratricopeptide (TPR) repeat protein